MQSTTTTVTASDGTALHTHRWLPDGPPKAVVQIAHGMAEHSARYARLAEALTAAGYAVYANDHRGHGDTASKADHGYFADHDGWDSVVADLRGPSPTSPARSTPACRSSSSATRWAPSWPAPTSSRTAASSPAWCSPAPRATRACSARSAGGVAVTEARLRGRGTSARCSTS